MNRLRVPSTRTKKNSCGKWLQPVPNKANSRAEINPVRWDMAQFIEIRAGALDKKEEAVWHVASASA